MIRFILTALAACLVLSYRCTAGDTDDQVSTRSDVIDFAGAFQNDGWQFLRESLKGSSGSCSGKPLQRQCVLVHRVDRTKSGKIEGIGIRRHGKASQLPPVRIRYAGRRRL